MKFWDINKDIIAVCIAKNYLECIMMYDDNEDIMDIVITL